MALLPAALLSACATPSAPLGEPVLHYLRTNGDGSEPERIVVHVASPTAIEVFKSKSRCTNAAYVTAALDGEGQARHMVGGRLTRDLAQQPFAWLDDEGGRLVARLGARDAEPSFLVPVADRWVQYDFDFSDLIAARPEALRRGEPIAFDLTLIIDRGQGAVFENLGPLMLEPGGEGRHLGVPARHYRASGPALDGGEGSFWFRAADGLLLEARLPIPNHAEYRDFRLRLVGEQGGAAAWHAALADHWSGCSAQD